MSVTHLSQLLLRRQTLSKHPFYNLHGPNVGFNDSWLMLKLGRRLLADKEANSQPSQPSPAEQKLWLETTRQSSRQSS